MSRSAGPGDQSIELFENLTDDFGGFVSGKRLVAFGRCNLCGEVLNRMHSTDQNVAKGLTARFGIIERLHRGRNCMVRRDSNGVNKGHGFLSTTGRRNNRLAIGVLLQVPLGERLVVPTFARMEKSSNRIDFRLSTFGFGACIAARVIGRVLPFRNHWHKKRAIGISYDVHETDPQGPGARQLVCGRTRHHRPVGSPAPGPGIRLLVRPGTSRPPPGFKNLSQPVPRLGGPIRHLDAAEVIAPEAPVMAGRAKPRVVDLPPVLFKFANRATWPEPPLHPNPNSGLIWPMRP